MWAETCCKCGMKFGMPNELYLTALQLREQLTFYCPAGHPQHYVTGKSQEEKLRQERDRLKQREAMLIDEARQERERRKEAERSAAAYKGQTTRLKNRAKAGVCPCCNRTFENLKRHMDTKHPDFSTEVA